MLLKQKRGVSVIIGYVLLVVFAMVISVGVYAWLKTYVPNEPLNCPDGVSLFVKESGFNSSTSLLNIKIRNNGRFDAAGYFIHATNNSAQQLPSIDLSSYLNEDDQGIKFGNSVLFSVTGDNSLSPGEEKTNTFTVPAAIGNIYSVRVIPTRFQEENNRQRFVSCGDARVQQIVGEPAGPCVPSCSGKECGSDGCGGSCGTCTGTDVCNGAGQCVPPASCTDTCTSLGYQCNNQTICGIVTDCGTCGVGLTCNVTGQCVSGAVCGNSIIDSGEQCDGTNLSGQSCTSQGFTGGTLGCNATTCQFDTSQCTSSLCGNGVINSGEQCDDGNTANGDGCSATCTIEGPITLFFDNFETYTSASGSSLHSQMGSKNWTVGDIDNGDVFDDIYLNTTIKYEGTYSLVIKDFSNVTANISTIGFGSVNLSYYRRTSSTSSSDRLRIYWRVGNAGSWTLLEAMRNDGSWSQAQWSLPGADNANLIQVRFYMQGDNSDYGLVDLVNVTGTVI